MQQYFSILKKAYDQNTFQRFAHELLNDVEIGNTKLSIDSGFQNHIESFIYLGSYQDQQGKNLHILDVTLKTNTKLEQARTMQRNLIARYLKDHWLDGALVAFHNDNSSSWRLSFVKVEYKYDDKGKPIEELTPARRYSFLVGEDEPSHTAQTQLAKIYEQTAHNPTLAQLEEAFGVEKVTKEFFEKYRGLFESVVAELRSNHTFQNEASRNNIDTESFAKKLLGQIVFLYFLQKKGWLGVPKGKSWGEGDKMFLRNIYNQAILENKNFFNSYLEVLFYDTLNNPRNDMVDRNYSDFFQSKIPFLNGGLFEPQYDWRNSLMYLDNKLFDKVLGVFDTYNFTVKEDEPLEKEVAVDPEMLGKVFENLLEENLRKGKGTYYTPREIVHYMCEESLVNYVASETGTTPKDVKSKYFPSYNVLGDEKFEARDVSVSEKIIESLMNIKIVDPACGSGAFLVGMLQQITQLRNELEARSKLLGRRDVASTEYEIKKQTIQNCIYGVDIDPGAIEIAKLRLWLSLVVDYDLEEIEPLPNLDYKLMQGNSLLEELVLGDTSIKLYDSESIQKVIGSKRMKNLFDKENQIGLFDGDKDKVMKSLKSLQLKYFSTSDGESKKQIRNKIEKIEHELIETSVKSSLEELRSQKLNVRIMPGIGILPDDIKRLEKISSKENQIFAILDELNKTGTKPFFLWHLYFADVFEEKGGFDVVIANPPYVSYGLRGVGKISEDEKKTIKRLYANSAEYKISLYAVFMDRAMQLCKPQGIQTFIVPDSFLLGRYFSKIRRAILDENEIIEFLMLPYAVFSATVGFSIIYCFQKKNTDITANNLTTRLAYSNHDVQMQSFIEFSYPQNYFECTKYNRFRLFFDKETKDLIQKIDTGSRELGETYTGRTGVRSKIGQKNITAKQKEKDTYQKGLVSGGQLLRFKIEYEGDWINIDPKILNSGGWDYEIIHNPKILIRQTGDSLIASIDKNGYYHLNNVHSFAPNKDSDLDLRYVLGILNSILMNYYYQKTTLEVDRPMAQTDIETIESLPIKYIIPKAQKPFIEVVDKILAITDSSDYLINPEKQAEVKDYERQIDQLVYKLYDIKLEEIAVIEGKND